MNVNLLKTTINRVNALTRGVCSTPAVFSKKWRVERGLSANRTAEGVLTDGPDYTFLDGRPTPLLVKQKKRIEEQRAFAHKIVEMCAELDFAKERLQKMTQAEEEERQNILANRLKPKGHATYKKN